MFKKIKAIWELTRLEHGLIYALGVLLSLVIAYEGRMPAWYVVAGGMLGAILAEMGAFALNDYFDVEVDKINNRVDRPIIRGDISKNEAMLIFIVTSLLSLYFISYLGRGAVIVVIFLIVFSALYNYKLKEYGIWGNIFISFTMASPFLFGSVLFASSGVLLVLSVIAFLIGLGREIMKGIMDVKGDALRDVKTVARTMGTTKAKYIAVILYVAGGLLTPIPYFFKLNDADMAFYHDPLYAVFAFAAIAVLCYVCYSLLRSHDIETIGRMRKVTLIGMVLALAAFFFGALF
jgi:geranylgeranylglycerol-phosphate geranylgeranyltransferase